MNVKKIKGSKALALFLALTMVMMYSLSFATAVYGDPPPPSPDEVKVHIPNSSLYDHVDGIKVEIELTNGAIATSTSSAAFGGGFNAWFPSEFLPTKESDLESVIVTLLPGGASFEKAKSSQIGKGVLNIWIEPLDIVIDSELTIVKHISGSAITDDKEFGFTVTGPTTPQSISVGAVNGVITGLSLGTYLITEDTDDNYLSEDPKEVLIEVSDWTKSITFNNIPINEDTPTTGSITIHKHIGGYNITDDTEFEFCIVGEKFADGPVYVSAGAADAVLEDVPFGEYIVFEVEMDGYLPVASQAAIVEEGIDSELTFNNILENPTVDLGLEKTVNDASLYVGDPVSFTVTITNNGTLTAAGISVQEIWPSTIVSLNSSVPAIGTTYIGTEWLIDSLAPAESKTLVLSGVTIATATTENAVRIDYADLGEDVQYEGYEDGNLGNDRAFVAFTVLPKPTTTTTTTTTHRDRDIPNPEVIPEPEVPLADTPVVTPEVVVVAPVILEEPVPLADVVPQTSDAGNIWLLIALMLGSGVGIATLGRRKETE